MSGSLPAGAPGAGRGATVVVTGGTGGIGLATARALAADGARVVLVGRDAARGEAARAAVAAAGAPDSWFVAADLSALEAVRSAAAEIRALVGRPDVLVANAGGLYARRWTTTDGHEASLAMNLLSPYVLADALLAGPGTSRLVAVSTGLLRRARADLDDPQSERRYRGLDVYGRTKLYGAAALLELGRRRPDTGVVLADPGGAATDMTAGMTPASVPPVLRAAWPLFRAVQSRTTTERAARSSVVAATGPDLAGGVWLDRRGRVRPLPGPLRDPELGPRSLALAERLSAG